MGKHEYDLQRFGHDSLGGFKGVNTIQADDIPRNRPYNLLSAGREAEGITQALLEDGQWPRAGVKGENTARSPMVGAGAGGDLALLEVDGERRVTRLTTITNGPTDIAAVSLGRSTIPVSLLTERFGRDCRLLVKPGTIRDIIDARDERVKKAVPPIERLGPAEIVLDDQTVWAPTTPEVKSIPEKTPIQQVMDAVTELAHQNNSVMSANAHSGRKLECFGIKCTRVGAAVVENFEHRMQEAIYENLFFSSFGGYMDTAYTHFIHQKTYDEIRNRLSELIRGRRGRQNPALVSEVLTGLNRPFTDGSDFFISITYDKGYHSVSATINFPKKK